MASKDVSKSINEQVQRKLFPEPDEPQSDSSKRRRKMEPCASSLKDGNGVDQHPKCKCKCQSNQFRVSSMTKWYPNEDFDHDPCPVCCNCKSCLIGFSLSLSLSPKDIKGYSCSQHDQTQYSQRILQTVFPLVTSLSDNQLLEKNIEAKIKGLSLSELQLESHQVDEDTFCDKCGVCIFDLYRSCSCGYDLCLVCCRDLRDTGLNSGWKPCITGSIPCPPKDIGGCDDGILELKHMMPVNWIANLLEKTQGIFTSYNIPQTCEKYCMCCDPNCLYSLSAKDIEPRDMQHFQFHWEKGEPIIVNDVLSTSQGLSWEPMVLWRAFHHITRTSNDTHSHAYQVKAVNCLDWSEVSIDLYKFFRGYEEGCPLLLKLEDWQPCCLSEEKWPHHFVELVKCLPFKDYTHPHDGYLNLVNKLDELSLKPDMGPRLDIAYAYSVTKLHCDKSDTVNVLTHISSTKLNKTKVVKQSLVCEDEQNLDDSMEEGALWDIFRRQDIPVLEEYLRKHSLKLVVHPIHDFNFYLNTEHKRKLKQEYGIEPWTIKQKLGDAVFIPAGCPYQVRNLKSNTKVEINFISPEGLGECIRLQHEFHMLPNNHRAKKETLNIGKLMIYAFAHAVEDLTKGPEILNGGDANICNDWIYESDRDKVCGTSKDPLETQGVWQGHAVGPEAKELLQAVEHLYPNTFHGVHIRSKAIWEPVLEQFHLFIKRFSETYVDTLAEDYITTLHEDVNEFETFGFDLSWAHLKLQMVEMVKFGNKPLRAELTALEESVAGIKERLVEQTTKFVEVHKMVIKTQLEYDNAKDALNKKAREVAHKFGDDYDRVLKGQLGI